MNTQVCSLDQSQCEVCVLKCGMSSLLDSLWVSAASPPWPSLSLCVPGKVAIQKEDLQRYHNRDTWFQLQHVDADSEVQVRLTRAPGRVDIALSCVRETGVGAQRVV